MVYFVTEHLRGISKDERLFMRNVKAVVLPLVRLVGSAVEREVLVQGLSKKTGVSEDALLADLNLANTSLGSQKAIETKEVLGSTEDIIAKCTDKIFGILFLIEEKGGGENIVKETKAHLEALFGEERFRLLYEDILPRKNELVFEAELLYDLESLQKHLQDLVFTTEEIFLKKKQQELLLQIKSIEKDDENLELVKEYDKISKRIDELKKQRLDQDYQ